MVLQANSNKLHTAVVSPCLVTGVSPSVTHSSPLTFADLMHVCKALGSGWMVGAGVNQTSFVDVNELAKLYVSLVQDAISLLRAGPRSDNSSDIYNGAANGKADDKRLDAWGPQAYYFTPNIEMSWQEFMAKHIVPALKKYEAPFLKSETIKQLSKTELTDLIFSRFGGVVGAELWSHHIAEGFTVNMRIRATRAEKLLGVKWSGGDAGIEEAVKHYLQRDMASV